MVEGRWVLPQTVEAPAAARRLLASAQADAWFPTSRADDCALMATELVTNALVHGHGEISLTIGKVASGLRVEVHDGGGANGGGAASVIDGRYRESGRGLRIVDELAQRWGLDQTDSTTCAWFEVSRD